MLHVLLVTSYNVIGHHVITVHTIGSATGSAVSTLLGVGWLVADKIGSGLDMSSWGCCIVMTSVKSDIV